MRYLLGLLLFAWTSVMAVEISIPALTSPVMDLAGFLSPREREDLSQLAYEIHVNQGPQITVLTLADLQGIPIEEFSIRVAEKWKLGSKEKGNGLLIIISKAERKMRIEVGEGIEGEVTDFETNQYINKILGPAFRRGEFHRGLREVFEIVAQKFNISETSKSSIVRRAPPRNSFKLNGLFPLVILVLILGHLFVRRPFARGLASGVGMAGAGAFILGIGPFLLILFFIGLFVGTIGINNLLYALASGRSRYGGGGGFGGGGFGGGGGWSGGGGGFSGGGSSGSW